MEPTKNKQQQPLKKEEPKKEEKLTRNQMIVRGEIKELNLTEAEEILFLLGRSNHMLKELQRQLKLDANNPVSKTILINEERLKEIK